MKNRSKFVIVHDKKQREVATILQTLAASIAPNSKWELIRYKNGEKISDENIIFIGKEASRDYRGNFPDLYSDNGIHIGYFNSAAWIYCEKFDWTAEKLASFKKEMTDLYKKAGMDLLKVENMSSSGVPDENVEDDIVEAAKKLIKKGKIEKKDSTTIAQAALWGGLITVSALTLLNPVAAAIGYGGAAVIGGGAGLGGAAIVASPGKKFIMWLQRLFSESKRIECQYRFATVKFYLEYLKKYIGLEDNEGSDAEQ